MRPEGTERTKGTKIWECKGSTRRATENTEITEMEQRIGLERATIEDENEDDWEGNHQE